ncbi:unnamed protein product [Paramecium sonneborni]|uniref:Transmembrane protein n=1 Tax=Paramecium sonneborni TaxID=65129 RepID=A0A8S1RNG6_9CILI|nr:unnamed protein product [Paramecium sonneborni]
MNQNSLLNNQFKTMDIRLSLQKWITLFGDVVVKLSINFIYLNQQMVFFKRKKLNTLIKQKQQNL